MSRPVLPREPQAAQRHQRGYRLSRRTALVSAAFSLTVALLLLLNLLQRRQADPLNAPELKALKQALAQQPGSAELKDRIRALDQTLRAEFFRSQARAQRGAWLLLGGLSVFLLSLNGIVRYRPLPPQPSRGPGRDAQLKADPVQGRWAVGALGVLCAASVALLAMTSDGPLLPGGPDPGASGSAPESANAGGGPGGTAQGYPKDEEYARHWPRFRGPAGAGLARAARLPATWDAASGTHILWKTPLALPGHSSPIAWGEQVFLTGADSGRREVYALDLQTGKLRWTGRVERVPGSPAEAPEVMSDTGFAAPTPASDGRRVYALFANGDLIAFSLLGQRVWARSLGLPVNPYGHAASLLTWRDLLIVPWDQQEDPALLGLEGASGKEVWRVDRKEREIKPSWTTPVLARSGQLELLITCAQPKVIAYDPQTGNERWVAAGLSGESGASPLFAAGLVFASGANDGAAEGACLLALRPDGQGELDASHLAWKASEDLPDIASPVSDGERLWVLTTQGRLTCYRARDGKRLYQQELEGEFRASPTVAGERLILQATNGKAYLVGLEDEYRLLGEASLGEPVTASAAVCQDRLLLRGERHLFCIGLAPAEREGRP